VDKKLDRISDDISEIKTHLAVYNEQLKHHIKRSDQADAAVQILDERIKPIEQHVIFINNATKVISIASAIILFGIAVYEFAIR